MNDGEDDSHDTSQVGLRVINGLIVAMGRVVKQIISNVSLKFVVLSFGQGLKIFLDIDDQFFLHGKHDDVVIFLKHRVMMNLDNLLVADQRAENDA